MEFPNQPFQETRAAVALIEECIQLGEAGVRNAVNEIAALHAGASRRHTADLQAIDERIRTGERGGQSVPQLLDTQAQVFDRLSAKLARSVEGQADAAERARSQLQSIEALASDIRRIAFENRIVTVNAAVEAAQLGEKGEGFRVIAQAMGELNKRVEKANAEIEQLAANLAKVLPRITDGARAVETERENMTAALEETGGRARDGYELLRSAISEIVSSGLATTNDREREARGVAANLEAENAVTAKLRQAVVCLEAPS